MHTEVEQEARELMLGASRAVHTNEAILQIQLMPEVNQALNNIIQMHSQSPYTIVACAFLLGVYMGIQYNDVKVFMGE
jgi:hypothetical protein